ncbi:hypothetical protein BG015_000987 [Linnemannia schmuckeri]|uniref:Major facilitator superfamily (MFS) profile domain-containing protein n=1 Tax=Linnemannia schmuckeri TaxID=64567 RepID=A0A9P5V7C7_9FUNG|nr:hypothetical protein BG015_000987 [Linnemannia schmuckeri]
MAEDRAYALQIAEKGKLEAEHAHSIDSIPTAVDGKLEKSGKAQVLPAGYVDQSRVLPPKELALVFVALMIVILLASLDQTIVSVLIPALGKTFNAPQYIAWVGTSYLLTSTAITPLYGKLSDIFGRKSTILVAVALFLIGSLICGAAPNIYVLIFGRSAAGSGAAGMISLTMIIISDVVSMRERGKYQGIIGSMFGLSSVIGPLLGGVLAEKSTWRWAFYLNLPLGIVGIAIVSWILRLPPVEGTRKDKLKRVDFLGSFTIVVGIVCVLLSTNWGGNEYAWNSVQIIVPYVVGGLFLFVFLYVEAKVAVEPIMPFRLFSNQSVSAAYITSFFIGGAFMGAVFYCPLYFQMVMHYNATKAGIHLLPMVAGMLFGGIGGGVAVSKSGRYRPFIWGALVIYTTGIALLSLWDENSGMGVQIGFLFVVGLGLGGCMQNIVLAGQCAVSQADIATVTSMMSFFRSMGGVVCVAIGGSLINNILTNNGVDPNNFGVIFAHPEIYARATQAIFRQCIAWPVLAFIASLFLKHHKLRKTPYPSSTLSSILEYSIDHFTMIFSKTVATFATLASMMAFAQADMLSLSNPTSGTIWKVGDTVFLQWKGNCASMGSPAAKTVDVNLMSGPSTALRFVAKLASIDCSNTNTRKEFTIPADLAKLVKKDDDYSLQVQTEPQPSYSPTFKIETGDDSAAGADGSAGAGDANGGGSVLAGTDPASHTSGAAGAVSSIKNGGSTATGAAVALAAVLVAAQLL